MDYRRTSQGSGTDEPPLSRLFIIGPKSLTEDDYRKHFEEYGTMEEIWMVKDKNSGEYKGLKKEFKLENLGLEAVLSIPSYQLCLKNKNGFQALLRSLIKRQNIILRYQNDVLKLCITYIKYGKTSEAARALEAMNGASLQAGTRRIKVMIAASRDQGAKRDTNEEEKTQRLFIVCPKSMSDDELYDYFKQFGDLEYAGAVKDRSTRESKGIAYIKYYKYV